VALSTKAGKLANNQTTTGRKSVHLTDVVSLVGLFVYITGTATVAIEVGDNKDFEPVEVKRVTTNKTLVRVFPPCSIIASNVIAVTGSVTVLYRAFITDDIVGASIESFESGNFVGPPLSGKITTIPGTAKILGQADPLAATLTDLYTVPASTSVAELTITVANRSATGAIYRIALAPAGEADANKHYVAFDFAIAGNDAHILHLGYLGQTDKIRVRTNNATVSFVAMGIEYLP